jgi:hypothetical protein
VLPIILVTLVLSRAVSSSGACVCARACVSARRRGKQVLHMSKQGRLARSMRCMGYTCDCCSMRCVGSTSDARSLASTPGAQTRLGHSRACMQACGCALTQTQERAGGHKHKRAYIHKTDRFRDEMLAQAVSHVSTTHGCVRGRAGGRACEASRARTALHALRGAKELLQVVQCWVVDPQCRRRFFLCLRARTSTPREGLEPV